MSPRRLLACLAALALWIGWALPVAAHEVRPALVQIVETGPGDYDVTWKRPVVGDMALRLVPHLSGGALDKPASAEQVAPGYMTRLWQVRGGPPLDGQTLSVEGLEQSVTDGGRWTWSCDPPILRFDSRCRRPMALPYPGI